MSHAVSELRRVIIVSIWQIERKSIGFNAGDHFFCVKKYLLCGTQCTHGVLRSPINEND